MTARRTRRISSSLLPENMTPAMTSMRPGRVRCCMRGGRVVSRGGWVKETQLSCGFSGGYPILWRFHAAFPGPRPSQGDTVNKAELIGALAMRTKMSKADASRAIEALFDDKGIIAGELKKGAKVQITGFGNFEARKRAARMGRNPKTGGVIQIKASIAPAFRAGKQLKLAVNNKK